MPVLWWNCPSQNIVLGCAALHKMHGFNLESSQKRCISKLFSRSGGSSRKMKTAMDLYLDAGFAFVTKWDNQNIGCFKNHRMGLGKQQSIHQLWFVLIPHKLRQIRFLNGIWNNFDCFRHGEAMFPQFCSRSIQSLFISRFPKPFRFCGGWPLTDNAKLIWCLR